MPLMHDPLSGPPGLSLCREHSATGLTPAYYWREAFPVVNGGGDWVFDAEGAVSPVGGRGSDFACVNNYTPASADYEVMADLTPLNIMDAAFGRAVFLLLRYDPVTGNGYAAGLASNGPYIISRVDAGVLTQLVASGVGVTNGTPLSLRFQASGTTLNLFQNGTLRCTTTDATYSAANRVGLYLSNGSQAARFFIGSGWRLRNFGVRSVSSTLDSGPLQFSYGDGSSLYFQIGRPAGGTSSYTYRLYRATTSGVTPGGGGSTLVQTASGQTGPTVLTDATATADTLYYYRVTTTDSAGTPAVVTSNEVMAVLRAGPQPKVGFVGDSITRGVQDTTFNACPPPTRCGLLIAKMCGTNVIHSNRGVSGSTTATWLPTDTTSGTASTNGAMGTNNIGASITAFNAAGIGDVFIRLGVNDSLASNGSVAAAAVAANLSTIITFLKTNMTAPVKRFFLDYPTLGSSQFFFTTQSSIALCQTYYPAIAALANGTDVFIGDDRSWSVLMNRPEYLADGLHPTDLGSRVIGENSAMSYWRNTAAVPATRPLSLTVRGPLTVTVGS